MSKTWILRIGPNVIGSTFCVNNAHLKTIRSLSISAKIWWLFEKLDRKGKIQQQQKGVSQKV